MVKGRKRTLKLENLANEKKVVWGLLTIYAIPVFLYLYLDCFSGNKNMNSIITGAVMLLIAGILLLYSGNGLYKTSIMKKDLRVATKKMQNNYQNNSPNLKPESYSIIFESKILQSRYRNYQQEYAGCLKKNINTGGVQIQNYINDNLIDQIVKRPLLSMIPSTMIGLGMLGTFIGLSMGMEHVALGKSADILVKSMEPLMGGIGVAFHTSIFGVILSLAFNFFYKMELEEVYDAVEEFLDTYQLYISKIPETEYEVLKDLLISQRDTSSQIQAFLEATSQKQVEGMDKIMDAFMTRLESALVDGFEKMGNELAFTFDKELAEITEHLSGTIKEIENTVDLVPEIIDQSYANMEESFKRFQKDLDGMIHCLDLQSEIFDAQTRLKDQQGNKGKRRI